MFLARINSAKSDPKKTWKLINELSSRKVHEPVNVKSIKQDDTEITNPYDIANAFNTYFTTIGDSLANELPHSDINPISYLYPVNSSFSFAQINVETVTETLKAANSNKATGPDNIPVRVLKIAAEILSPSLTAIFNRSPTRTPARDEGTRKTVRGTVLGRDRVSDAVPGKVVQKV